MVWIESRANLHCPTCDGRLIEHVGRFDVMGKPEPTYMGDGLEICQAGHPLPDSTALVAYRDSKGHPPEAPYREVPTPPGHQR